MHTSRESWRLQTYPLGGASQVDQFLDALKESDPPAIGFFLSFILPKLEILGPAIGEPYLRSTSVPELLCLCWPGTKRHYKIFLSIEEGNLLMAYSGGNIARGNSHSSNLYAARKLLKSYRLQQN